MVNQAKNNININDEHAIRMRKLSELQEAGIAPYPAKVVREQTVAEAQAAAHDVSVNIAGRIMAKREMGKLCFCHVEDESGRMQIVLKKDDLGDSFAMFVKKIDIADIVSVVGKRFVTKKGEESILVSEWTLLTKTLRPLPDKFHGLQDEETRYRKRYLDLLVNKDQREKLYVRARVLRAMREFMHREGFIEMETPMLETIASGTMARSFETHLNAFDLPVHLRIAGGELWLKRLMVAGFEKIYDMGRVFRNEGVDFSHNPEFTMIEYYWAYADYTDNMKLHERMIPYIVKEAVGKLEVDLEGTMLDFSPPYPQITFREAILEHAGIDISDYDTPDALRAVMREKGLEAEADAERGKLLDSLFKQTTRPKIIQPTFVLEYPVELKPLAKRAKDPRYTEMFQLIVNGFELTNNYTELNDPIDQRERFEEQARIKAGGEEEDVMLPDDDFVVALEHGMPPSTGTGIGIDRFVALITGSHTVREVTAFPLMKPKDTGNVTHNTKHVSVKDDVERKASDLPMGRDEAWELVKKYNTDEADLHHYRESEVVLRALAKRLGRDVEYWGMLGMMHDIDWGLTKDEPKTHLTKMPEIMREAGFPEQFIEDILSHGYGCECADLDDMTRDCEIQYALAAGETVTGLVYASARMRPDKIASLTVKSLKKKFKNLKFAAKVDRDVIRECEKLGIELDEFFQLSIDAIREIADEIGLV